MSKCDLLIICHFPPIFSWENLSNSLTSQIFMFFDKLVCYENYISHTNSNSSSTPYENHDYTLKTNPGENQLTSVLALFFLDFMLFAYSSEVRMYNSCACYSTAVA